MKFKKAKDDLIFYILLTAFLLSAFISGSGFID